MHNRSSRRLAVLAIGLAVGALLLGPAALGVDVYTPQTGEVELEGLPRDTVEQRFNHAAALIGAGDGTSGVRQLEKIVKEDPDGPFAERACYWMGLGFFTAGTYSRAFDRWDRFHGQYPESALRDEAYEWQLTAAKLRTRERLSDGMALFDRLIASARSREFAMRCQKEKADEALAAEAFIEARDHYLAFVDRYPDSPWVPYCWFKVAECELGLAHWIRRGTEHLNRAQQDYAEYVRIFPNDSRATEATERIKEIEAERAAKYRQIAEYYLGPAGKPTAALVYLEYIVASLPGTEDAKWAEAQMEQVKEGRAAPLRGEFKRVELPGVSLQGTGTEEMEGQE